MRATRGRKKDSASANCEFGTMNQYSSPPIKVLLNSEDRSDGEGGGDGESGGALRSTKR